MRARLPLLLAVLATGCTGDDPADRFIAVILGSVLVILLIGSCGSTLFTASIAGGAINAKINLSRPTSRSRRWGWAFGVVNLLFGAAGVGLVVLVAQSPGEEPPGADVYLLLGLGTLAAFAVGGVGLYAAIRPPPAPEEEDV
ncbi:MAG: hypothetical protein KF729_04500 [Sandaracinaceae bacterium]|nr:hypothetical protein [Sandaracinaceae bacterium]